jgi:hypothetical protein
MQALVTPFQPLDDLEENLISSWCEVSRATHRFLVLLREFDLRQGWQAWGCADCADWLNLKCGITRNTAQEKLRVAKSLWDLPQIEEAFKRGDLSYSKVRALTRVVTAINETDLLDYALGASAAQVEGYCRKLRNGSSLSTADAQRAHAGRSLFRSFREDGTGVLTVELPRDSLELVLKALEQAASRLPDVLDCEDDTLFTRGADALVMLARDSLCDQSGGSQKAESSSAGAQHQILIVVDAHALSGHGGKSDLPVESVRRLCCDGSVVPIVENDAGEVLSVGRKQRTVPTAIRRALVARDRTCTFPGCSHDRWIDAHHIQHWAQGGETSLENLVLLCTHHHKLVHEGGFKIERRRDGSVYFARPDGRVVETPSRSGSADPVGSELPEVREAPVLYEVSLSAESQ